VPGADVVEQLERGLRPDSRSADDFLADAVAAGDSDDGDDGDTETCWPRRQRLTTRAAPRICWLGRRLGTTCWPGARAADGEADDEGDYEGDFDLDLGE
jgi:hypothetical protein